MIVMLWAKSAQGFDASFSLSGSGFEPESSLDLPITLNYGPAANCSSADK